MPPPRPVSARTRSCRPRAQLPPRPFGASQRVTAAPPVAAIFFSLPSAKNAIHWPSGEKNGLMALTVPDKRSRLQLVEAPHVELRTSAGALLRDEREHATVRREGHGRSRVSYSDASTPRPASRRSGEDGTRFRHGAHKRSATASPNASAPAGRPRQRTTPDGQRAGIRRSGGAARGCRPIDQQTYIRPDVAKCVRRRSFSRQRCKQRTNRRRTSSGSASQSGSPRSTAASVSDTSSPSNTRVPVSISNSTHPNAQMSAALVDGLTPRLLRAHVSGGAEHTRRRRSSSPGDVMVGDAVASAPRRRIGSSAFARPKSSTFTVPSGRTLMFAGFRSRWMMPCSCAASSASAICLAMGSASSTGIGPARCGRRASVPRPAP